MIGVPGDEVVELGALAGGMEVGLTVSDEKDEKFQPAGEADGAFVGFVCVEDSSPVSRSVEKPSPIYSIMTLWSGVVFKTAPEYKRTWLLPGSSRDGYLFFTSNMNAPTKSVKKADDVKEGAAAPHACSCRLFVAVVVEPAPASPAELSSFDGGIPNNGLPSGHPKHVTKQSHLV
jgi:hypothetical protein